MSTRIYTCTLTSPSPSPHFSSVYIVFHPQCYFRLVSHGSLHAIYTVISYKWYSLVLIVGGCMVYRPTQWWYTQCEALSVPDTMVTRHPTYCMSYISGVCVYGQPWVVPVSTNTVSQMSYSDCHLNYNICHKLSPTSYVWIHTLYVTVSCLSGLLRNL